MGMLDGEDGYLEVPSGRGSRDDIVGPAFVTEGFYDRTGNSREVCGLK